MGGRQVAPASPWCHCPICISLFGVRLMESALANAAETAATLSDLLERHFTGRELVRQLAATMAYLDGLTAAHLAADRLDARLDQPCLTFGVKTMPEPAHSVPPTYYAN